MTSDTSDNRITIDLRSAVGRRIRSGREAIGLSSRALAVKMGVDPTSVVSWEAGKYLPTGSRRARLAGLLNTTVAALFDPPDEGAAAPGSATLTHTHAGFPDLLVESLAKTRSTLRAFRFAAPYSQPAHVQVEFREAASQRILAGSLMVQRAEIIYTLERLKAILHNIFIYDGRSYDVKVYCAGLTEVAPAMGGYIFDDDLVLVGAYWTSVPPLDWPGLTLTGEPFKTFFKAYWDEIWRRGSLLNLRGKHDLCAARAVALALGLDPAAWTAFVEEARDYQVGDGAPPLI